MNKKINNYKEFMEAILAGKTINDHIRDREYFLTEDGHIMNLIFPLDGLYIKEEAKNE